MRLLLVGALPYPHHQGSQVYLQEQAIALRTAGVDVELLTYASGLDPRDDPGRWRALDGFRVHRPPRWTAPGSLRAGPSWGKPLADLALARALRNALASCNDAPTRYDAIMTHNAEAALIALHGLPRARPPVVYCVHTLLEQELPAYRSRPEVAGIEGEEAFDRAEGPVSRPTHRALSRLLARLGGRLDARLARRCDGWIALTQSASRVMRRASNAPGALIPPPLPDPRQQVEAPEPGAVARRHGLTPGGFLLYSGNLDAYQELGLLAAAARRRTGTGAAARLPIVVASHDRTVVRSGALAEGLEGRHVASAEEMQALMAAARASVVTRRAEGGLPIKLVNSLAVGTPPIVFLAAEWGLEDGVDSLVARGGSPAAALAACLDRIASNDRLAEGLRKGARARYERAHRPERVADETIVLVERVLAATGEGRGGR